MPKNNVKRPEQAVIKPSSDLATDISSIEDVNLDEKPSTHRAIFSLDEVKALERQYDRHILTYLYFHTIATIFCEVGIGNAFAAGMTYELRFKYEKFADVLNLYTVGVIAFSFTAVLWRAVPPKLFVPWVTALAGCATSYTCRINGWPQLMGLRLVTGALQASMYLGRSEYLTAFYYFPQVAARALLLESARPLACALVGLIGYGSAHDDISGKISPWRVIMLVAGIPSVIVGLFGIIGLPSTGVQCRFLRKNQRKLEIAQSRSAQLQDPPTSFSLALCVLFTLCMFTIAGCVKSLTVYMPDMIKMIHFTTGARAQLLTVPPYLVAWVVGLLLYKNCEKIKRYTWLCLALCLMSMAGYVIVAVPSVVLHNQAARYGALFLIVTGTMGAYGMVTFWFIRNFTNISFHAPVTCMILELNAIISERVYLSSSRYPPYAKGNIYCAATSLASCLLVLALNRTLHAQNNQLRKRYGDDTVSPRTSTVNLRYGQKHFQYMI